MMTAMKSISFWDVMPCSLVEVYQHFRRTCSLHLHDRRQSTRKKQAANKLRLAVSNEQVPPDRFT
jgi:hypothetical protein